MTSDRYIDATIVDDDHIAINPNRLSLFGLCLVRDPRNGDRVMTIGSRLTDLVSECRRLEARRASLMADVVTVDGYNVLRDPIAVIDLANMIGDRQVEIARLANARDKYYTSSQG